MARTLVATEIGVRRAKEALIDLGITQTVLAEKRLKYSRSTVSSFFNRKPIAHENFTEICKILKLEWRDVAEMAEEEITEEDLVTATIPPSGRQEFQQIDEKVKQVETQIRLAFAIAGTVDQVDQAKLTAIVKLLRKITGDASIEIVGIQEGSIKLILTGKLESLEMIQALYRSGQLTEINAIAIEYVELFVDKPQVPESIKKKKTDKANKKINNSKTRKGKNRNIDKVRKKQVNSKVPNSKTKYPLFFKSGRPQKSPSIVLLFDSEHYTGELGTFIQVDNPEDHTENHPELLQEFLAIDELGDDSEAQDVVIDETPDLEEVSWDPLAYDESTDNDLD